MAREKKIAIRVAGHPWNWLMFYPERTHCGGIEDGVAMSHANCEDPQNRQQHEGDWVIAFSDLEAMYLAAKAARKSR